MRKTYICPNPNCDYKGIPHKEAKGNIFIGLLLCLFWFLPGIIYFLIKGGYIYSCPKCGLELKKSGLFGSSKSV
jgi:hypothetical protein